MIEFRGRLGQLTEVDDVTLARLGHRLEQRATEAGLLDVAFRTIDSPVGPLLLAATPLGLVRVAYQREGHDAVLQALASKISRFRSLPTLASHCADRCLSGPPSNRFPGFTDPDLIRVADEAMSSSGSRQAGMFPCRSRCFLAALEIAGEGL